MKPFRSFKPYRDRPLCFLDIETTGLKPRVHEITEIGIRHTERGDLCLPIAPQHLDRAEPEALRKSGYNSADWADADSFTLTAPRLVPYLEDATIVAHNAIFEIEFLKATFETAGLDHSGFFRDAIDTQALARIFLVPLGLNLLNMQSCMKFIDVEYEGGHNAYEDALFAEKLYRHITENLKWHGKRNGLNIQESIFGDDR